MCAKADHREGFRVLAEEWRRMIRRIEARWRRRFRLPGIPGRANANRPGLSKGWL